MSKRPGWKWLVIPTLAILLGGCNQVSFSACPPLVTYSAEFQREAAKELPKAGPKVQVLVNDYGNLRAACRVI